jgi:hypothetical protein
MARLPDRFDLWVRKARACPHPARQLDYILGALLALPAWHFLHLGPRDQPQPAIAELETERLLVVFTDPDRVIEAAGDAAFPTQPPVYSLPAAEALRACLADGPLRSDGLLINPGEEAAVIPHEQVAAFEQEWREQGGPRRAGFWIPHATTEEEDFWQEHGL